MKILKYLLMTVMLLWGIAASAQYNPADPPEPGVNFTLTVKCSPAEGGFASIYSQTLAFGSRTYLWASPHAGFSFLGWTDSHGNLVSPESSFYYTMPAADTELTANFEYNPDDPKDPDVSQPVTTSTVTLLVNPPDAGWTQNGGTGTVGETRWIYAYDHTGFRFVNWTKDGKEISTERSFRYTIERGDPVLVANFVYDPDTPADPGTPKLWHNVTLQSNLPGACSGFSGFGSHEAESDFWIDAYPNTWYYFKHWEDEEGTVISEKRNFRYIMPDRDVTLTAVFEYDYNPADPGDPAVPVIPTVAPNTVIRPRFAMDGIDKVVIMCETDNAELHYTLDGTEPTQESPLYTGPVYVARNLTVKAVGFYEGMYQSPTGVYNVTSYVAAAPQFAFRDFKIHITSDTPGAVIRYTTDYSLPNEDSPVYTEPFTPEENCRIRAYASKEGLSDSRTTYYLYRRYEHAVKAPQFRVDTLGRLEMSSLTPGAEIRYTFNGPAPDKTSTLYTGPVEMTEPGTYRAIAVMENWFDSDVTEYSASGFPMPTPTARYKAKQLFLECGIDGGEIYYTTDYSDPSGGKLYDGPIPLDSDLFVRFMARKEGYADSEANSYEFRIADYTLPAPYFVPDYSDCKLYVAGIPHEGRCSISIEDYINEEAIAGTPYPVAPHAESAMLHTTSLNEDYYDPEDVTFEIRFHNPPVFAEVDKGMMQIEGGSETAIIDYETDGDNPVNCRKGTLTGIGTVEFDGNIRFFASQWEEGMFRSVIEAHKVENMFRAPTPSGQYKAKAITLHADDPRAKIFSSQDGAAIEQYSGAISVDKDTHLIFISRIEDYDESLPNDFIFVKKEWTVAAPEAECLYDDRRVVFNAPNYLTYTLRGHDGGIIADETAGSGCIVDVDPEIASIEYATLPYNEDWWAEDPLSMALEFYEAPFVLHDGWRLHAGSDEGDEIHLTDESGMFWRIPESFDEPYCQFGTVTGVVVGKDKFRSDKTVIEVKAWYDPDSHLAAISEPGLMESLIEWIHMNRDLTVKGNLNERDVEMIIFADNPGTLDLTQASVIAIDNNFICRAQCVLMPPQIGYIIPGTIGDYFRPAAIVWHKYCNLKPDINYFDGLSSKRNTLLFTDESGNPGLIPGINVVVDGKIDRLDLVDGKPFYTPYDFQAGKVSFTREFTQTTSLGSAKGWESLGIPFKPSSIMHETKGMCAPFADTEAVANGAKPFWLYRMTDEGGFERASSIEADAPYIISMPNNTEYDEEYNLGGKVTFSASDVTIHSSPAIWKDEFIHKAYPDYQGTDGWAYRLNVGKITDSYDEGSVFVYGHYGAKPFEAVFGQSVMANSPAYIIIKEALADIQNISGETSKFGTVEVVADGGSLLLTSPAYCTVTAYDTLGNAVCTASLKAGETYRTERLQPGLYIVAGRKIFVK